MSPPGELTALVTGAEGQLGLALQATAPAGWRVAAYGSKALDIGDAAATHLVIERERPDLVFNSAAYTSVDAAESEPERAEAVNVYGAANVAKAAQEIGARVIHISTDFVFDGRQGRPYRPDDPTNPLGVYGRTKLEGEREVVRISGNAALIVRTAWVYSAHRRNFVLTMLRLMRARELVRVVCDQIGTPTSARSLADELWAMADKPEMRGVHHWTDAGVATWYDFAVAIQEESLHAGLLESEIPILPITTSDYPTAAARPAYSVLDKTATWAALGRPAHHWRVNLRHVIESLRHG
ncbi:MAG: dTDP-4-dehydrorhamnose reductase [Gemmatimonadales bacterium]